MTGCHPLLSEDCCDCCQNLYIFFWVTLGNSWCKPILSSSEWVNCLMVPACLTTRWENSFFWLQGLVYSRNSTGEDEHHLIYWMFELFIFLLLLVHFSFLANTEQQQILLLFSTDWLLFIRTHAHNTHSSLPISLNILQ